MQPCGKARQQISHKPSTDPSMGVKKNPPETYQQVPRGCLQWEKKTTWQEFLSPSHGLGEECAAGREPCGCAAIAGPAEQERVLAAD